MIVSVESLVTAESPRLRHRWSFAAAFVYTEHGSNHEVVSNWSGTRMKLQVLLRWRPSNLHGWGIVGLNLFKHWASDPDIQPLMGSPIEPQHFQCMDPLRVAEMWPAIAASNQFLDEFTSGRVDLRERMVLVIDALGNRLNPPTPRFISSRNVGRCIFEDTRSDGRHLAGYDCLLCASQWSARLLRATTNKPVIMIHEGVDTSHFFPGPRSGVMDAGRFYVFSGGKIEFRKAHDLVVLAFRQFAARHDDVVLVAAWNSTSPEVSDGFRGRLRYRLRRNGNGALDIKRWVTENGIPSRQFIELPLIPNPLLPTVYREMDCAVQVSRCEACTNLPAAEAMACGVPVILANNSGMRDLIDADNCIALRSQDPVVGTRWGTDGWGESSVDEIVGALEKLYTDSQLRRRIGAGGAAWVLAHHRTWQAHAAALKSHLLNLQ